MKVISVNVGKPKIVVHNGKEISTGIYKSAVSGPVEVTELCLAGDGQADLKVHGGRDKAVYVYPTSTTTIGVKNCQAVNFSTEYSERT